MTSIVYALVARGNVILTEYIVGDFTGNFAAVNRLLSKLESQKVIEESKSYVFESKDPETGRSSKYAFHYIYRNHLIFLALTTLECSKSAVMQFLGNVHRSFIEQFGQRGMTANAYQLNNDFKYTLGSHINQLNGSQRGPSSKSVENVQRQIQEVRHIMIDNIESVIERGQKIDELVVKSEDLAEHASLFQHKSTKVRQRFACAHRRALIIGIIVFLALAYAGAAIGCGGPGLPKCV